MCLFVGEVLSALRGRVTYWTSLSESMILTLRSDHYFILFIYLGTEAGQILILPQVRYILYVQRASLSLNTHSHLPFTLCILSYPYPLPSLLPLTFTIVLYLNHYLHSSH